MTLLRGAIVGLRRGQTFVKVLSVMPDATVCALVDIDPAQRAETRALLPADASIVEADTLRELLAGPEKPDFVVIATPPIGRVADVELALAHGVHVLCEIPAVWTRDEADRLLKAVQASTATYMMAENCLAWGVVNTAREIHHKGELGDLFFVESEMYEDMRHMLAREPETGWRHQRIHPIVYCSHSIGPMLSITKRVPVEVSCVATSGFFEPGMNAVETATIRFDNGTFYRLTISLLNAHWHSHRFVLHGTEGTFESGWIGRDAPRMFTHGDSALQVLDASPDMPGTPPEAFQTGAATMNWWTMRGFLDSIINGTPPPVDVYTALTFSMPGVCAAESAEAGGVAVAIPQYERPGA